MTSTLNDKQMEAVRQTEGAVLILAGAGSGKTMTMTHRIVHLVENGTAPWRILAVTFTNKAAGEIRARVRSLVGDAADEMWLMTFHAMCLRMLFRDPERVGYKPGFLIYDTADQRTVVKNILKEHGINDREYKPQSLLSAISACKEKEMSPADFREASIESPRNRTIGLVYDEYEKQLRRNNAMDFDDLLLNALRLLRNEVDVRERYQQRFEYIMVDEYQDTNHVQYELVKILAGGHGNVCVVGDDDQCIYEWRGADIRNILDFERDFPGAKIIKLEQNYRSTGNILAAAHSVIRNNRGRKAKKLWTTAGKGEPIHYARYASDHEEASSVARTIGRMKTNGRRYSDFVILYRTNAQSRLFEEALSLQGIPYQILSGMRYYDRAEVKDLMAYLRMLVNPDDDLSFTRIVNRPRRGIGDKTLAKIAAFAQVRGQSLLAALADPDHEVLDSLSGKARAGLESLVTLLTGLQNEQENMTISEIYDTLLTRSGYLQALEASGDTEDETRIDNLMEFKTVIAEFEKRCEEEGLPAPEEGPALSPLETFMSQLTLAADVDSFEEDEDRVVLMTLHSAKGLEFPVVFMPGMEDGLFPGSRAFDDPEKMEEERRLCYVGMTRAKELLYLSSAEVRTRYGRTDYTRESQFLRELDPKLVTGDTVYERTSTETAGPGVPTGSRDGSAGQPYRPFDVLTYAARQTVQNVPRGDEDLQEGDRVRHKKFGEGVVLERTGSIVKVAFEETGEIRKLAVGIAPLVKI